MEILFSIAKFRTSLSQYWYDMYDPLDSLNTSKMMEQFKAGKENPATQSLGLPLYAYLYRRTKALTKGMPYF